MSDPVEVTITGASYDCDMCGGEHYAWDCPGCGEYMDHFEDVEFPLDVRCVCGVVSRITKDASARWEREVVGREERR